MRALPNRNRAWAVGVALVLAALVLVACGPNATVEPEVEPVLTPGTPLPTPVGATHLTVSGRIAGSQPVRLDCGVLEAMGTVRMTVRDPWLRRDVTYSGVLLSDLVSYLQVDEDATLLHVVSLDDYAADIALSEIAEYSILLATRTEDEAMAIADGGPTRIVFPYDDYPDLAVARNLSVWNIARIEVR